MKVVFTGGGTGGHVNPAIAIADTVKRAEPGSEISFVGTSRGIENKLCADAGYPVYHVDIQGLRRKLTLSNLKTLYLTLTSPYKARKLLLRLKPDIVLGTGGYVCWPVVKAAAKMGIPTALHESNAVPGAAVKLLSGNVDRIYLNFSETAESFTDRSKLYRVGNPLRNGFSRITREEGRRLCGIDGKYRYTILSFGGSLGAEMVNEAVLDMMRDFSAKREDVYHIHACGSIEWEAAQKGFAERGLDKYGNLALKEYIFNMPELMAAADLVICRAGAMTVSELAMCGKCVIFIPSPNVTNNHQYKNAALLRDGGAAELIEERELTERPLASVAERLLCEEGESARAEMCNRISRFAIKDACDLIYRDMKKLISEKNGKRSTGDISFGRDRGDN